MNDIERYLQYIPWGHENAITRDVLKVLAFDGDDRKARKFIADATEAGYPIVTECDGKGYFLTDDPVILERDCRREEARAKSILRRVEAKRSMLKGMGVKP